MFLCRGLAFIALLAPYCPAQTKASDAELDNSESLAMELMVRQSNPEIRLAVLERFWKDFQRAGKIRWAYDEICRASAAADQSEWALTASEKLLAWDPRDVEIAEKSLKLAEDTKDAALIEKWSALAGRAAECVLSSPLPGEAGKRQMAIARLLRERVDYLAYSAILQIADFGRRREALEEFLECRKGSVYKSAAEDLYLQAWRESGDAKGTLAAAKKILEQDDSNLSALAIVADSYHQSEREPQKLMVYARRILAVIDKQPKQEGFTDAEWSRQKALLKGHTYWVLGSASMQQDRYKEADRSLRAALPYVKEDSNLLSTTLFYLGWANYQLGNLSDALRFNKQCTLVKGPYQAQAMKSVQAITASMAKPPEASGR
jgi:tetratricopeptide (TPR) repeat protein